MKQAEGPGQKHSGTTTFFNNGGFTLIELLVVVLIIGILAAVALPQYQLLVEKARATEALINLRAIHNAVELYYLANGVYPASLADIDVKVPASRYFDYDYNSIYVGVHSMIKGTKGRSYSIFRMLEHRTWNAIPGFPNAGCHVIRSDDGTSSIATKLCKRLCQTSALTVIWGSGEKGCRFNM